MKTSLLKDTFREIKKSLGRFLSIFCIVTLGVAFFSGVKVSSPNMNNTVDKYYDNYNLMDIQVISNLGLTSNDIEELKKINEVEAVKGTYSKDVLTNVKDEEYVTRVHGFNIKDSENNSEDYINRLNVTEGRLPKNANECVIDAYTIGRNVKIGEKISLYGDNSENIGEDLKNTEYTVVGKVATPYYISHQKGSSTIKSGQLASFIMVPDDNFKSDIYTEAFLTVKNAKNFISYSDEYDNAINKVEKEIENIGFKRASLRYDEIVDEAKKGINEGKSKLEEKRQEVNKKLEDSSQKLIKAKEDIKKGEKQLTKKENETKSLISNGNIKIDNEENRLLENEKVLNNSYNEYLKNKPGIDLQIESSKAEINNGYKSLDELKSNLSLMEKQLASGSISDEEKIELEKNIINLKKAISGLEVKLSNASSELNSKIKELNATKAKFENSFKQITSGKEEIKNQRENLVKNEKKASKEFEKAREDIENGKADIVSGEKEYEKGKKEAESEFLKAEEEIKKSEIKLQDIKKGEWYVLDRNTNYGFVDFKNSSESISKIAQVFPVFFFLVAALICLTTMTRMVDEQRVNIGTLKGLGYGKISIASKYIIYAALASIGGSIVGLLIGLTVFPSVIYNAYASTTYYLPPIKLSFDLPIAFSATLVAILTTTLAVIFACYKELLAMPSVLMRPKAPKQGKRILLERIPFIWKRMNFTHKVTARNIFRYKKRFFMTVIGISGCTALLLCGFGIKDSVSAIIDKQYGEVFKYTSVANYKSEVLGGKQSEVQEIISKNENITNYQNVRVKNMDVFNGNSKNQAKIFVMETPSVINEFVKTSSRDGKKNSLTDNGVIISEKLSKLLKVKEGDTIKVEDENKIKRSLKVEGISENYVSHYIYMTPSLYKKTFKIDPKYNQILLKTKDTSKETRDNVSKEISKDGNINSVEFNSSIMEPFKNITSNLNYVIILMTVSAGALAFVVLYNLTNVNISERLREIATIKVLGFYDNEVSSYVFRENIILTFVGTISGLVLGVFLHRFIIVTAELEAIMFGRNIEPFSFIISAGFTLIFAFLVNLFMYFKLKKIKMVESLKSVD